VSEKRYKIVVYSEIEDLEERVNELMREGWTPTGGVVVMPEYTHDYVSPSSFVSSVYHAQAMILLQSRCSFSCAFDEHNQLVNIGSLT